VGQVVHHALADVRHFHLGQLKPEGRDDVVFFRHALAVPEQRCLRKMVVKRRAAAPDLRRLQLLGIRLEAVRAAVHPELGAVAQRVGFVRDPALGDGLAVHAVALEVMHRADGLVDRDFMEVGAAQA
jgi:hypothetical protein